MKILLPLLAVVIVTALYAVGIYCSGWHFHRGQEMVFVYLFWLILAGGAATIIWDYLR